eukprot:m.122320 g.122320  ORF g.122320 m.122320 type:complete len:70 (-) comp17271_c0_seq1:25-234(-)
MCWSLSVSTMTQEAFASCANMVTKKHTSNSSIKPFILKSQFSAADAENECLRCDVSSGKDKSKTDLPAT